MIYGYISPFIILIAIFIATLFIIDWLAKILLYTLILNIMVLPFYLLYKEEVRQDDSQTQSKGESNSVPKNADS